MKRIGFETVLDTIKQRKSDDADVFKHGVNVDGECIFDPDKNCLGQHINDYHEYKARMSRLSFNDKISEFEQIQKYLMSHHVEI